MHDLSGAPTTRVEVPQSVAALSAGWMLNPVWVNELGGITFEMKRSADRRFLKWAPAGSGVDLHQEAERCRWAAGLLSVPYVLQEGRDDAGTWLITAAIPGDSAVSERWKGEPATAARAIGQSLRQLHDTLPVEGCPFTWSVEERTRRAHIIRSETERLAWPAYYDLDLTVEAAFSEVASAPPIDKLVVCHGDPCVPNTLLAPNGAATGMVDLGSLGVADRWADLAVATWSTVWNYGPGFEDVLLDAYGISPDPVRTRYYRLLWAIS